MRLDTTDAVNNRGQFSGWESGKIEVRLEIGYEKLPLIRVSAPLLTINFRECAHMPNDFIPVLEDVFIEQSETYYLEISD